MSTSLRQAANLFADPALKGPGLWRTLRESIGGNRRLLDVAQIEVTSLCPGGCVYCPHTTMRYCWKERHMAAETYIRLWPLLLETARVHLQGWGEPLLHPRFLDMVALARKADCQVSTTTCGLVMNEGLAASLVDCGLDIVAFSLTGTTAASHNEARCGVDFARLLESVRILQAVRREKMGVHLELHFAYLMLAGKMKEVLGLPELMQELGIHAAIVSTLDYLPSPEWAPEAFAPHEADKIAQARSLLEVAASKAASMDLSLTYALPGPQPGTSCLEHPERSVYIDADGNMSPCIYANVPTEKADPLRRVFGSCLTGDPLEIWSGRDFAAFRQGLASRNPDRLCLACPKRFAVDSARE